MSDHDELFRLHQLFFTGQYAKVVELNNDEYSDESKRLVDFYKVRSLISLNKFDDIESLISGNDDGLYQALGVYSKFVSSGLEKNAEFEKIVESNAGDSIIGRLGALYYIKLNELEEAIKILEFTESLENTLFLVEIYLILNDLSKADATIKKANNSNDEIILNLADNLINSLKNGENLRSVLYFFEELAHQNPSLITLLGLFVINLQLNQLPEAEIVLNQLEELGVTSEDLLANEVAYYQIKNDSATVELKRKQLAELNSQHPAVLDYTSKNELFDTIVEKYKEQLN
jgi:coatomer protein complex subunit epsilon